MQSQQDSLNKLAPPTCHIDGVAITAGLSSGHSWQPAFNGNVLSWCRGAFLKANGTPGYLAVHLIDDPVGVWYLIYLVNGAAPSMFIFDLVGDSNNGTTVTLDAKVSIFPGQYANISDIGY
jgi:hypothetical protein